MTRHDAPHASHAPHRTFQHGWRIWCPCSLSGRHVSSVENQSGAAWWCKTLQQDGTATQAQVPMPQGGSGHVTIKNELIPKLPFLETYWKHVLSSLCTVCLDSCFIIVKLTTMKWYNMSAIGCKLRQIPLLGLHVLRQGDSQKLPGKREHQNMISKHDKRW